VLAQAELNKLNRWFILFDFSPHFHSYSS